jgi:hypothetical protein
MLAGCWLDAGGMLAGCCWLDVGQMLAGCRSGLNTQEVRAQLGGTRTTERCARSREARAQLGGAHRARMRERSTFNTIIEPECERGGAQATGRRSLEARIEPECERGAYLIQSPSLSAREQARTQQVAARAVGRRARAAGRCARNREVRAAGRRTCSWQARIEPQCESGAHFIQ